MPRPQRRVALRLGAWRKRVQTTILPAGIWKRLENGDIHAGRSQPHVLEEKGSDGQPETRGHHNAQHARDTQQAAADAHSQWALATNMRAACTG